MHFTKQIFTLLVTVKNHFKLNVSISASRNEDFRIYKYKPEKFAL